MKNTIITITTTFIITVNGFLGYYAYDAQSKITTLEAELRQTKDRQGRITTSMMNKNHWDCRMTFINMNDISENRDNIQDLRFPSSKHIVDKIRNKRPPYAKRLKEAVSKCDEDKDELFEFIKNGQPR